jgi:hypothetical protein
MIQMKLLTSAIVLALAVTAMSASANAGPLRDKLKSGLTKGVSWGIVAVGCTEQLVTKRKNFFCKRPRH